jgi:hypothetical protein
LVLELLSECTGSSIVFTFGWASGFSWNDSWTGGQSCFHVNLFMNSQRVGLREPFPTCWTLVGSENSK